VTGAEKMSGAGVRLLVMNEQSPTRLCFGSHAAGDAAYIDYHDTEWGRPIHDDTAWFERLCLEMFQVGLSWRTVLHKRDAFRECFMGFDPGLVAGMTDDDVERLLTDTRIIRNRAKITACIQGARIVESMRAGGRSLSEMIWSYRPAVHTRPDPETRPSPSPEGYALARDLRGLGFRFVGPVNMYATLQAGGVVNDHVIGCRIGDGLAGG